MSSRIRNYLIATAVIAAWAAVSEMDAKDYELAHGTVQVAQK
ncbi:MAG: hypothetical protein RLZ25_2068 [Pseudomonadota bacterium]|jgi:hypothetical protein